MKTAQFMVVFCILSSFYMMIKMSKQWLKGFYQSRLIDQLIRFLKTLSNLIFKIVFFSYGFWYFLENLLQIQVTSFIEISNYTLQWNLSTEIYISSAVIIHVLFTLIFAIIIFKTWRKFSKIKRESIYFAFKEDLWNKSSFYLLFYLIFFL